jgi:hypothetical protein
MNRYIQLSDTIIDRRKVTVIYRDPDVANRCRVVFENGLEHYFEGGDMVILFQEFRDDPEKTWRDDSGA